MSEMKLIMENWRSFVTEDANSPETWGELAQKITLSVAAEKWPRIGKTLARFGFKVATNQVKNIISAVESVEEVIDWIPEEMQIALESGSDRAVEWLADKAKSHGGRIGAFVVDDLMGMDDSLAKTLPGFEALNIEDEYQQILDKEKLKKWAKTIIKLAKTSDPDSPLPDLNHKLEKHLHDEFGAHPDVDVPDVRPEES
jgi:hypothetical protein